MRVVPALPLICPHDGCVLEVRGHALVCARGHSFDRAREGYVNVLPVQDKASLDPGDSKAMVAARHRFLETGCYAPIADAVAAQTTDIVCAADPARAFTILDAGCGEGYYLQALAGSLGSNPSLATVHLAGIDISKWAVRTAAKRAVPATWAVASNRRPPLPPHSADLILCLFGFPLWAGFGEIQPSGGHVLLVDPGPDHLLELRTIIYPEVRRSERTTQIVTEGYLFISEQRIVATTHVGSPAAIADLLSMTPHAHRASAEGRIALAGYATLDITIDVFLRVFRRMQS